MNKIKVRQYWLSNKAYYSISCRHLYLEAVCNEHTLNERIEQAIKMCKHIIF